jgi:hypothetical protein
MFHSRFRMNRTVAAAAIAVGFAIAFSSLGIVRAEHFSPDKKAKTTFNCSTGTACLTANSTGSRTWALYATGTSDDALHAVTSATNGTSGLAGIATGTSGSAHGVYGASSNGDGVYGTSSSPAENTADVSAGVYGVSTSNGSGVIALARGGNASLGEEPAIIAEAEGYGDLFYAVSTYYNAECTIDGGANLDCSGSISGGVVKVRQKTSTGRHVLTYASRSASETIEDVGTARMYDGVANVQISSDFAGVMDGQWYYVFLTPLGDTRGLYVSRKSASGFQVRETEHGRGSLEFDYRIVAHPLGAASDRLPPAPSAKPAPLVTRHS